MPVFDPQPVSLENGYVRLEPLLIDHAAGLLAAGDDDETWRYLNSVRPRSMPDMERWIAAALAEQVAGQRIPFAIFVRAGNVLAGSSSFLDLRPAHRALEIGWTWLGPFYRRTAVNTAAKLLLLEHAFDALGAVRVQFKTDSRNERSQRALERLGAAREGVLRRHVVLHDGFVRDSVCYSILAEEWPAIRTRLLRALQSR